VRIRYPGPNRLTGASSGISSTFFDGTHTTHIWNGSGSFVFGS
jgi:hypothetical protein